MAPRKVYVIGVGMTKFEKPQSRENFEYRVCCLFLSWLTTALVRS